MTKYNKTSKRSIQVMVLCSTILLSNFTLADRGTRISSGEPTAPRYARALTDSKVFGTAPIIETMQGWNCLLGNSFDTYEFLNDASIYISFGTITCGVQLPSGARLTHMELEACDEDGLDGVFADLYICPSPNDKSPLCTDPVLSVETGDAATPGCAFFRAPLPTPSTIDNATNVYQIDVATDGATNATRFRAVRLLWERQISPAPTSATFGDVPTSHPFFPAIEAMVASGVTGGCSVSPPAYCPDATVTRGQMAAFLARALGLHFSN